MELNGNFVPSRKSRVQNAPNGHESPHHRQLDIFKQLSCSNCVNPGRTFSQSHFMKDSGDIVPRDRKKIPAGESWIFFQQRQLAAVFMCMNGGTFEDRARRVHPTEIAFLLTFVRCLVWPATRNLQPRHSSFAASLSYVGKSCPKILQILRPRVYIRVTLIDLFACRVDTTHSFWPASPLMCTHILRHFTPAISRY